MNWLNKIILIFKTPDLRKKILFVLGVFAIFRLMAQIKVPGISLENIQAFYDQFKVFNFYSVFTGGSLDKVSIIMLGLGPYITATIIFQLLTMIFPQLEKLYKEEGEQGRQRFNQYCRIAAIPLAALQGYAMLSLFQKGPNHLIPALSPALFLTSIITITAGAIFLMWLGELISEKGIGNGVSLLILAGIVSNLPSQIVQMKNQIDVSNSGILPYIFFFTMSLIIVAGVVLINEARRNIPVSYAKRIRGMKMYGGVSTYLPLNINPAGVIPIIFASSILLFPAMIGTVLGDGGGVFGNIIRNVGAFFDPAKDPWGYGISYFVLVVLFTYFYTAVTFDPKAISENLQKMGGFVPGIRPGESTAKFMYFILNRVLLIGALFLGLVAVMPSIIQGITKIEQFQFLIGGTSLLIVVSVVLETMRQIQAQLQMREYENF
ncbi:MAG: preprotein translocase subunit SecY [Candidatus Pacebacteria bacterium]|nr:preprotein translocase subunit SecY [Candidatus Paceibacterota bacterium]